MIRRQHVVKDFFGGAEAMRQALDARFRDAYTDGIPWHYFCAPGMYTYLRTNPANAFPREILREFVQRLREWCLESLGLSPMNLPYLHLMINGCKLGLHSDFHNGAWGYVYSLTRWDERKFSGGETLVLRDGIPSYKKHHVHGDVLYELIPAQFNQLFIFDDRIVHATPAIEGSMDPLDGRIAMVGHIRAASPTVRGRLHAARVREVVLAALPQLRERVRAYKEVQGTISFKIEVTPNGLVDRVGTLTDNLVAPLTGYEHSDAVLSVRSCVQQTVSGLRFPSADGRSTVVLALLVPLPDLRPIEMSVPHESSVDVIRERMASGLEGGVLLDLRGTWNGNSFDAIEPVAGSIRIEAAKVEFSFDPPMWVPSQRESFQKGLISWAQTLIDAGRGEAGVT